LVQGRLPCFPSVSQGTSKVKKKPKKANPNSHYSVLIPTCTLQRIIGIKQWEKLRKYIKKRWPKTRVVLSSYTNEGLLLVANRPTGQQLGLLKNLLVKAKIQSQPEEEIKFHSITGSKPPKQLPPKKRTSKEAIDMEQKLQSTGL
jgi:hypothetical protein